LFATAPNVNRLPALSGFAAPSRGKIAANLKLKVIRRETLRGQSGISTSDYSGPEYRRTALGEN
jgi:hypothetical protein